MRTPIRADASRPSAAAPRPTFSRARRRIVDLGCGPGVSTRLIAERDPEGEIVGLDSSPDMLAAAGAREGD
jgi:trans-aconitate 2-methyltransferase